MIPEQIVKFAIEATSNYNDGYTAQSYKRQLEEIRDYINRVLSQIELSK